MYIYIYIYIDLPSVHLAKLGMTDGMFITRSRKLLTKLSCSQPKLSIESD